MKKTLAIILFIIMILATSTYSFAAGTNGKIIVENPANGQEYTIYKLFDLESYNTTTSAYSYTIDSSSKWYNFVTTGNGKNYINLNQLGETTTYYVTWKDGADAEQFAKEALAYAKSNTIAANATKAEKEADNTIVFSNLDLGYYLVDSSLGALCALNTTAPEVRVSEKNDKPTVEKTTKEGSNYGESNDAELGAEVDYKTIIHAKKGAENYVLHDKMTGLTLKENSVSVKVGGTNLTANTDYTISTSNADGCQFEITFTNTYLNTITANTDIIVEYKAIVNADATIAGAGNTNEAWLKYGDTNDVNTTEKDTTTTYVWNFNIFKYTGENTPLAGANFVLSNSENKYAIITDGKLTGWANNKTGATKITSGEDGMIAISGFDSGTYTLEETDAPNGYNKLADTISVVIGNDGAVTADEAVAENKTIDVENSSGALLPSTGSIGTKIFYVAGGILVIVAIVFIIVRKRMNSEE
ncbi:MAG: SpaH/EbpB family LPXTG-anchored major pilin [Clostridia bacterium]|nr:SpaH/EbpB family LPXTG-anchored major pilin [Clostridia bacterium]